MSYREPSDDIVVRMQFQVPDKFRLLPTHAHDVKIEGRWLWIKKLAWWSLCKLGCVHPHFDREQMVTCVRFSGKEAMDLLMIEVKKCMMMCYGRRPKRIFLGSEDFARIMSDPAFLRMGYFDFSGKIYEQKTEYDAMGVERRQETMFNVPVEVIPHMQGVLVI